MKFARIIFANLLRKKVRLLLTVGSFAVALFLLAFLGVLKVAFRFWADAAVANRLIVVNRTSYFNSIPLSYKEKIVRIPGVKCITHSNWFVGIYQDGKDTFPQFVIDPEGQREVYPEFIIFDYQWQAFLKDQQGAIVGAKTAERLHWKLGDRIPLTATLYGSGTWEMNLVGIYHCKRPQDDETQFWIRWDYFNEKVPD